MFSSGWLVPIPIAIPNLIWALSPKAPAPEPSANPRTSRLAPLALVEGVGRVAVLALPCFLEMRIHTGLDRVLVSVGVLALGVYYAGWARYFLRGGPPHCSLRHSASSRYPWRSPPSSTSSRSPPSHARR
jgi:hypothetical protein